MQFVWWLTGVLATLAACKFVLRLFKRLTGKENIDKLISAAGDKIHEKADKIADKIENRRMEKEIRKHVQERQRDEENRPIITIR